VSPSRFAVPAEAWAASDADPSAGLADAALPLPVALVAPVDAVLLDDAPASAVTRAVSALVLAACALTSAALAFVVAASALASADSAAARAADAFAEAASAVAIALSAFAFAALAGACPAVGRFAASSLAFPALVDADACPDPDCLPGPALPAGVFAVAWCPDADWFAVPVLALAVLLDPVALPEAD
jgi:hypothetical protein